LRRGRHVDLSLAVLKEVERQGTEIDRQWKLRLERARYEAGRAERHYKAVEPENRLVARSLETQWNQKLEELAQVEREYEDARRGRKLVLDADDRKAVMALAKDVSKVWSAPTTKAADRKQLLRVGDRRRGARSRGRADAVDEGHNIVEDRRHDGNTGAAT
jgi:hypothetical protein